MRQHFNKALQWSVLGLAVFAVGSMAVIINRGSTDRAPAPLSPVAQSVAVDAAAPSYAPKPAPSRKLTRVEIAQQKKAAAIAAKPTRFETSRADDVAMAGGGILGLLMAVALIVSPFWLFVVWRRWMRRRRAIIQGEGFEEGRMRARARAGLI